MASYGLFIFSFVQHPLTDSQQAGLPPSIGPPLGDVRSKVFVTFLAPSCNWHRRRGGQAAIRDGR